MSEPIILFDPDGREVVVHGRGQAGVMVAKQGFTWTRPESGARAVADDARAVADDARAVADDAPPVPPDSPVAPQSPAAPQPPAADDAPAPTGPRHKGRG